MGSEMCIRDSVNDEVFGLDAAPNAFVDLLAGGNVGSRIVRLDG